MVKYLFALFVVVPMIEVWLLIAVGQQIGGLTTVALVIATAVIGSFWLRAEGLDTIARLQANMQQGQLPALELVEGAMLLVAGALLITPGFFTDAVGALLLWPVSRRWFANSLGMRAVKHFSDRGAVYTSSFTYDAGGMRREDMPYGEVQHDTAARDNHDVIEGEYVRDDEDGDRER